MSAERNVLAQVLRAIGLYAGLRVFRNNTGTGWTGNNIQRHGSMVTIHDARPLEAGLIKGSSDLIGWQSVTITPDMVGKKVAIFVALEVKSPIGRATPEQLNFIRNVNEAGGIAGVVRSPEDAEKILKR